MTDEVRVDLARRMVMHDERGDFVTGDDGFVGVTCKELWFTVALILPAAALGEWLGCLMFGGAFNGERVFDWFWGALSLAVILALTFRAGAKR